MPSPFPGMDPYLEDREIWPDFHAAFACELSAFLNQSLPSSCYARLQRRLVRDVSPNDEPLRHNYIEVRNPSRGHHLITLIEIVSPNCKRSGADRESYFRKQREVLDSDASLIEIDLLRAGLRPVADAQIEAGILGLRPTPDYLIQVHRAWTRIDPGTVELVPIVISEVLPVIAEPLRQGQDEVLLDVQFVFNRAYDGGPYRRGAIDYTQLPRPLLHDALAEWGRRRIRDAGLLSTEG